MTDDARKFTARNLKQYRVVVFLNTSGDVLNDAQQAAFEDYYRDGGGFVGIHSAIETEPDWSFLTDILGTRATGASAVDRGDAQGRRPRPPGVRGAAASTGTAPTSGTTSRPTSGASRTCWPPSTRRTYTGGTMGFDHPITWCKDYQGGRSFYTGLGDTVGQLRHQRPAGPPGRRDPLGRPAQTDGDCGATVLANYQMDFIAAPPNVNEPIGFDVLPDGRVVQTDRRGGVRLHDPATNTTHLLAQIPVYMASEDGMYGPAVDNDFATNKWVYLYYSPLTHGAAVPGDHADGQRAQHRRRPERLGPVAGLLPAQPVQVRRRADARPWTWPPSRRS